MRAIPFLGGACALLWLTACEAPTSVSGIDETDEAISMSYHAPSTLNATLPELSDQLEAGTLSSTELTQAYLDRIAAIDRAGPGLQAILSLNSEAMAQAAASDARRAEGAVLGPLDGLPILLKDNIESLDAMPTTAGALALKDNMTGRDSPLVAGLRARGAVILGKTNLSQWANFRSNQSNSGWSALGGQVRSPHMLDRNPCGSSSGSGVATAASLAAASVGTETNGSIICPAQVNGIVGFKPTVGVISAEYIIPISPSQDTAGPMTKSVTGAALMMAAMTGSEGAYTAALSDTSLDGKRVGVLRFAQGSNPDIHRLFNAALEDLEKSGAQLVEIEAFSTDVDNFWGKALTVLQYEFKHSLNAYLANSPANIPVRNLAELIAFNEDNAETELALFGQDLFEASQALGDLSDPAYIEAREQIQSATRANGIDHLLSTYEVDVLVSPSGPVSPQVDLINGDVWPDWAGGGWLAAIAGYPHLSVPMGQVHGVPVGLSLIGAHQSDAILLSYGYAYEQKSQQRVEPAYLPTAEARPELKAASQPSTD